MLRLRGRWRDDRGAVAVIVALSMVVVLGMAALVIDIGATQARLAQLQEAADAAALALAQECAAAPGTTPAACSAPVRSASLATASELAVDNLNDAQATVTAPLFTASTVKVRATSTQVGMFSQLFGVDSTGLTATATAKWAQRPVALPLAFNECSLPQPSATQLRFLRTDVLDLDLANCGLLGSVNGLLGASWAVGDDCSFDVNLFSYVGGVLSNLLPSECVSMVTSLVGKEVLLPVYDHVLGPIVVNGVLLGQGYAVEKYALVQVTGYDFNSLGVGPKYIAGSPKCPSLLGLEPPLCQGLQGRLTAYLTPDEAAQRFAGVQLIE